jgi:hypothetical protein
VACGGFATSAGAAEPADSAPVAAPDPSTQAGPPEDPAPTPAEQPPPAPIEPSGGEPNEAPQEGTAAPENPAPVPAEQTPSSPPNPGPELEPSPQAGQAATATANQPSADLGAALGGAPGPAEPTTNAAQDLNDGTRSLQPTLPVAATNSGGPPDAASGVITKLNSGLDTDPEALVSFPPTLGADLAPDASRTDSTPPLASPNPGAPDSQDPPAGGIANALDTPARGATSSSGPALSPAFASLPFASADQAPLGHPAQQPDPGQGPQGPGQGPGGSFNADGLSSSGLAFSGLAALLLALMAFAAPALGRRIRISPACWRPVAFVSLLERPG